MQKSFHTALSAGFFHLSLFSLFFLSLSLILVKMLTLFGVEVVGEGAKCKVWS